MLAAVLLGGFPLEVVHYMKSWICSKHENNLLPWLMWLSGLSASLRTKGSLV